MDIWNGVTFGANTFFTKRSNNSICYIGQVNYWVTDEHRTRLTASVYCGQNAIFAAPGLAGNFDTTLELRIQQNWGPRFTQIVQSNMGWDPNSAVGTGSWYGIYTIGLFHLNPHLDINVRGEWFDDVRGTRTGINTDYSEVTLGLNWHPIKCLEVRPEIRGDFAGENAFGRNGAHTDRSQLTGGISALISSEVWSFLVPEGDFPESAGIGLVGLPFLGMFVSRSAKMFRSMAEEMPSIGRWLRLPRWNGFSSSTPIWSSERSG